MCVFERVCDLVILICHSSVSVAAYLQQTLHPVCINVSLLYFLGGWLLIEGNKGVYFLDLHIKWPWTEKKKLKTKHQTAMIPIPLLFVLEC